MSRPQAAHRLISMRQAFGEALVEVGAENERVVVLDADVSKSTRTYLFQEAFPERFFNCGVAEQNMVGVAAGLATMGFTPVASSFAFLLSLRAAEQVRTSVAYPNLNVKLAGGYCGLSDSVDGATHQSVMDLAVMRAMPNMRVVCASDAVTVRQALRAIVADDGPWYLRLSRAEVPTIFSADDPFELGKARVVKDLGSDCAILVTGALLAPALEAQARLKDEGICSQICEVHTLKPLDREFILRVAGRTGAIVTVEEHSVIGGLGSAVAEVLAEGDGAALIRVGLKDTFAESGDLDSLYAKYGLDSTAIAAAARECARRKARG